MGINIQSSWFYLHNSNKYLNQSIQVLNQSILAFEWNCFQFLSCFGKDGNKCLLNVHQTTMTAESFPPQSIAIFAKKICCKLNTLQNVQAAAHQYLHNNTWEPNQNRFPLNLHLELSLDLKLNLHSRMIIGTIEIHNHIF